MTTPTGPAQTRPTVSIVMPVLNEAAILETALTRLRRDFADCELLVVDGGSTDSTAQIAAAWATVVRGPRGRARQMNEGARHTRGDVLWFVHADTMLDPVALGQLRAALADPGVVGGGLSLRFDARSPSLDYLAWISNHRARRVHHIFGDQAMFVRRAVVEELGGFPDLPLMEDLEFARRLHRRGTLVVLPATSTASARRFTQHGTWAMIAFMQYLKVLYFAGVDPQSIHRRYAEGPPRLSVRAHGRGKAPVRDRVSNS